MNNDLGLLKITQTPLGKDWECYQCKIGPIHIEALAIPAQTMNQYQWARISRARASYAPMWSPSLGKLIEEDQFDGLNPDSPYQVTHYIATATSQDGFEKVVTMRKVTLPSGFDASEHSLPEDINFWKVVNTLTGETQPLWQLVQTRLALAPYPRSVASISRTGTFMDGVDAVMLTSEQKMLIRDMSIIGFALIQMAATTDDPSLFWFVQLCTEFQDKVFALETDYGKIVLDFAKTATTFGLPGHYQLKLDETSPAVQFLKINFPGYWLDNYKAAQLLTALVEEGRLNLNVLEPYLAVVQKQASLLTPSLTRQLFEELTAPRNFKYLIPLLNSSGPLTPQLSGSDLRELMLKEGGDGPFSSTIHPHLWRKSAVELLQHAELKYQSQAFLVRAS